MKPDELKTLNYEQYSWIVNLSREEGERIINLMKTWKWHLIWREAEHQFVLVRIEQDEEE